jgi:hypothetical protein
MVLSGSYVDDDNDDDDDDDDSESDDDDYKDDDDDDVIMLLINEDGFIHQVITHVECNLSRLSIYRSCTMAAHPS